ncbi:unnamed protein product (macronuclear) [Paramecium tetraurelia]|uniref:Transmembrane protein n=1 Tax=Paramecium tetraurelia TaxID=5888 RepID=A0C8B5_PARTE|nr:uncharacterized protein GSPATT00036164001 [Paramecium tetraurelia]CAK67032.1 unnamed protein product [Paramecium tetraurelia]|eukprot:XP_001434429.1 hypothetical protein (macronuclear) [Paramecium tetraurelia strain d4-2]
MHVAFLLLFIVHLVQEEKESTLSFQILHYSFIYYSSLIYTPVIYSALLTYYEIATGDRTFITQNSNEVFLIISCTINLSMSILMKLVHLYFSESPTLIGDNNVIVLESSMIFNVIKEILMLLSVVLKIYKYQQVIRVILVFLKQGISLIEQLNKKNCFIHVLIKVVSMVTIFGLFSEVSICEYLLLVSIFLYITISIVHTIRLKYIMTQNQANIITLQISLNLSNSQENQIFVQISFKLHKCSKCKQPQDMIQCLFKSIVRQTSQITYIIKFCYFLSEKYPIKSLIKLLEIQTNNLYFLGTTQNLIKYLRQQSDLLLELSQKDVYSKKKENISKQLRAQTIYECYFSSQEIFPSFERVIISKINFYNHLIKGYDSVNTYINEALALSQNIIKCKQLMNQKYDMINETLKNSSISETLSMRIIQIYHSAIYNNQYLSFQIEKKVEEHLKNERFRQDEPLSSIQLIQNRVFIFQSSLIKNRGEFINLDTKKLSSFLEEKEEELKYVKHCSQLMPLFLSDIHDELIDKYIINGYTQTQKQSRKTFILTYEGYVEPCVFNIYPHFDIDNNDFIMNVIMSKMQQHEMILFGVDGSINGLTKQFYEIAAKSNYHFMKIFRNDKTISKDQSSIKSFLEKKPLIQYYIPNIMFQIDQLAKQYQKTKSYQLTNLKSTWVIPNNHQQCLISTQNILEPFKVQNSYYERSYKKRNPQMSIFKSRFDASRSRQTFYDAQLVESNDKEIDGIPIILLQPYLQSQLIDIVDFGDVSKSQFQLALQYDLQFNTFELPKKKIGYFVLTFTDFKVLSTQSIFSGPAPNEQNLMSGLFEDKICQNPILAQSMNCTNKQEQQPNKQEQYDIISEARQEYKAVSDTREVQKDNEYLNFSSANQSFEQHLIKNQILQKSSETQGQFDTYRTQLGPLILKSKFSENYNIEDIDLNDHNEQLKKQKPSKTDLQVSKKQDEKSKTKSHLKEFFSSKKEENNDFASNRSRSSVCSTQRETQFLVEQLYSKTQLILPLQKIVIILVMIIICIIVTSLTDYLVVVQNLDQQTTGVMNLLEPQNITYFYTSVIYQLLSNHLQSENLFKLSQFQETRNLETVDNMFQNARIYLRTLNVKVPKLAQDQGIENFEIKQVTNNILSTYNVSVEDFYFMLNEVVESAYRGNLNSPDPHYEELFTSGFLRLNILYVAKEIDSLVVQIIEDTISSQEQILANFQSLILIELFLILLLILTQLKYWIFIDKLQKSILFLVSHLNENQAIEQIVKLMAVKSIIDLKNPQNWKIENFSQIMMDNEGKKKNKQKQTESFGKPNSSESSLTSRIQKTKHVTKINYIIILLIIVIWIAYILTSYVLFVKNNGDFQPSLYATLRYGQFRIKMDIVTLFGGLIKTDNLIPENNLSFINQTETIILFKDCKDSMLSMINEISTTILENAQKNNQVSPFDGFLNDDICQIKPWEEIKACDPSKQNLPYSSKDSVHNLILNGILGYTASLVKYIDQDYNWELNSLSYSNQDENMAAIQSQAFQNYFLSYFCDTQDTFLDFLTLFKIDNTSIAHSIINLMEIYYLVLGFFYFFFMIILSSIWVFWEQKKMMSLRQMLVLIPQDVLQNQNMKNRLKIIFEWLY